MKVQDFDEPAIYSIRPKWLLVDDTEAVLQMTARVLTLFTNAEICCFQSTRKAIDAFAMEPSAFELAVTDFDMPEMNGAELCRRLRSISPALKTILMTGSADMSGAKARDVGFNAFLAKPFASSALSTALHQISIRKMIPNDYNISNWPTQKTKTQDEALRPERVASAI